MLQPCNAWRHLPVPWREDKTLLRNRKGSTRALSVK
jgi:hypothetical protein